MTERTTRNLQEEFDLPDRQELDDAVLELLGEQDPTQRQKLREHLYREMGEMYRIIRDKELVAMQNKRKAKGKRRPSTAQLADEIMKELESGLLRRFPNDFLRPEWPTENVALPAGAARLHDHALLGENGVEVDAQYIELGDMERARFAKELSDLGRHGPQPIPLGPEHCREALARYQEYREQLHAEIAERTAQKTADERLQGRVVRMVEARVRER